MPLSTGLEGPPQEEKVVIYPWNVPATKWFNSEELHKLRDESPESLAARASMAGGEELKFIIIELMYHGNPEKAARTARAAADKDPKAKELVKEWFGGDADVVRMLLKDPLDLIPDNAQSFRRGSVEYIN